MLSFNPPEIFLLLLIFIFITIYLSDIHIYIANLRKKEKERMKETQRASFNTKERNQYFLVLSAAPDSVSYLIETIQ